MELNWEIKIVVICDVYNDVMTLRHFEVRVTSRSKLFGTFRHHEGIAKNNVIRVYFNYSKLFSVPNFSGAEFVSNFTGYR